MVTILCITTAGAPDTSADFSVLAEAAGVALVHSSAPEGYYLASVAAGSASLLVSVAGLDEEVDARLLAEAALAAGS